MIATVGRFARSYVRTMVLVFTDMGALVGPAGQADGSIRPLQPWPFFLTSLVTFGAVEVLLYPIAGGYELPPPFGALPAWLPIYFPAIALLALVGNALGHFALMRLTFRDCRWAEVTRIYCYGSMGIVGPLVMLIVIAVAVVAPSLGVASTTIRTAASAGAAIVGIGSFVWIVRFARRVNSVGTVRAAIAVIAGCVVASPAIAAAREFLYESYTMNAASMAPTLAHDDVIAVNRLVYRWRDPRRGDLAVFWLPRDPRVAYIKRIVGLPGDRIRMRGGFLEINGARVPVARVDDFLDSGGGQGVRVPQYVETIDGRSHRILLATTNGALSNTPEYTVPQAHYFTLGDNRDNSLDSRVPAAVGFIPRDLLIGSVYVRLWPMRRGPIE